MDIRPPRKRQVPPAKAYVPPTELPKPVAIQPAVAANPHESPASDLAAEKKKPQRRISRRWIVAASAMGLLVILMGLLAGWYGWAISASSSDTGLVRVVIRNGEGSAAIAEKLQDQGLIRSATAFRVYTELTGTKQKLQAGGYALSPSMPVREIVEHMISGKADELNMTIIPGMTLKQQLDPNIENSLAQQGFSPEELETAFIKTYDHPLFEGKPSWAGIEGYLFPETYRIAANNDAESILKMTFDEFYTQIQESGLREKLAARNLTLYQGITLASVIQKEVAAEADQRQVAQVFLKRLADKIPLQSDPTFVYPARQDGREPTVKYDSPYNTYVNQGLPPGPIANFNLSALLAVAEPAAGDYLYFVADANGTTHYSRTLVEHEAKVRQFCTSHCNDF